MFEIKEKIFDSDKRDLKIFLSHLNDKKFSMVEVILTPIVQENIDFIYYETSFSYHEQYFNIYIYNEHQYYNIHSAKDELLMKLNELNLSNNSILISSIDFSVKTDNSSLNKYIVYIFLDLENFNVIQPKWNFYDQIEKQTRIPWTSEFVFKFYEAKVPPFEFVGFGYQNDFFKIYLKDLVNIVHESRLENVTINNEVINNYSCYFSRIKIDEDVLNILIAENDLLFFIKRYNIINVNFKSNERVVENFEIPFDNFESEKFFIYPLSKDLFILVFSTTNLLSLALNENEFKISYLFRYKFNTPKDFKNFLKQEVTDDMHRLESESSEVEGTDNIRNPWDGMEEEYQRKLDEDWIWKKMDEADREDERLEENEKLAIKEAKRHEEEMKRREKIENKYIEARISQDINLLSINFIGIENASISSLNYFEVVFAVPSKLNNYEGDLLGKTIFFELFDGMFIGKINTFVYAIIPNFDIDAYSKVNLENFFTREFTLVDEIKNRFSPFTTDNYPLGILRYNNAELFKKI